MGERTAAEVLAEKIAAVRADLGEFGFTPLALAARLAEDPAITVRTDLVVERYLVEIHHEDRGMLPWSPREVFQMLTGPSAFAENPDHRVVVRPYPEGEQ